MKRILPTILIAILFAVGTEAYAQNHVEFGGFGDYFRLEDTHTNFGGLGGRFGVNASRHVQIEAEMAYDFNEIFTERFTNTSGSVTVQPSDLRVLHGLFGPKIQTSGPVRVFVTIKGGFDNFRFDPRPPSFDTFSSSVDNLRTDNVNAALYPGGGVEGFIGPIGLRLEVGDEIFFNGGAHHNLRVSFGPEFRF